LLDDFIALSSEGRTTGRILNISFMSPEEIATHSEGKEGIIAVLTEGEDTRGITDDEIEAVQERPSEFLKNIQRGGSAAKEAIGWANTMLHIFIDNPLLEHVTLIDVPGFGEWNCFSEDIFQEKVTSLLPEQRPVVIFMYRETTFTRVVQNSLDTVHGILTKNGMLSMPAPLIVLNHDMYGGAENRAEKKAVQEGKDIVLERAQRYYNYAQLHLPKLDLFPPLHEVPDIFNHPNWVVTNVKTKEGMNRLKQTLANHIKSQLLREYALVGSVLKTATLDFLQAIHSSDSKKKINKDYLAALEHLKKCFTLIEVRIDERARIFGERVVEHLQEKREHYILEGASLSMGNLEGVTVSSEDTQSQELFLKEFLVLLQDPLHKIFQEEAQKLRLRRLLKSDLISGIMKDEFIFPRDWNSNLLSGSWLGFFESILRYLRRSLYSTVCTKRNNHSHIIGQSYMART
jgi:hypothetical protein